MALSSKQKRFCQEYVIDSNATRSAMRSGYSEKTARSQGQRLLTKVDIQKYIKELQKDIFDRNKMTVDECVQILSNMARFDIADLYNEDGTLKNLSDIPLESRMAIESLDTEELKMEGVTIGTTKKVKLSSRRANIIELMKYGGGYKEDNTQKAIPVRQIINMSDYKGKKK